MGWDNSITTDDVINTSDAPGDTLSESLELLDKLHFAVYSINTIPIGTSSSSPTYITGAAILSTSSPEFEIIDASTGLVRNNSERVLTMQGTVSYQLDNGTGGTAQLNLWSERSDDDGLTFTVNDLSLRTTEASNTSEASQTKAAGIREWAPGESTRFAMYNSLGGTPQLAAPSDTVNGTDPVSGFSFFLQLNEV